AGDGRGPRPCARGRPRAAGAQRRGGVLRGAALRGHRAPAARRVAVREPRAAAPAGAARRRGRLAPRSVAASVEPPADDGERPRLAEAPPAAAADAVAVRLLAGELRPAGAAELRAHGLPGAAGRRPRPADGPRGGTG